MESIWKVSLNEFEELLDPKGFFEDVGSISLGEASELGRAGVAGDEHDSRSWIDRFNLAVDIESTLVPQVDVEERVVDLFTMVGIESESCLRVRRRDRSVTGAAKEPGDTVGDSRLVVDDQEAEVPRSP